MILADTSVWVEHLRRGSPVLVRLLEASQVVTHPFVIGELACGTLRNRASLVGDLQLLPSIPRATDDEVLLFLERRPLTGRGLGLVDVHLLAAVQLSADARLLTLDRRLQVAAEELGCSAG